MSQPFIGEIRMFGGSFAPVGWAFCNGQLLPISEYDALYTLIGTTYGGDGEETFALPNLQSRIPVHAGQGPGISQNYALGEMTGVESVTVTAQQTPIHNHALIASTDAANTPNPQTNVLSSPVTATPYYQEAPSVAMNAQAVSFIGTGLPHDNMMPFLVISFIISLYGIYPQQN